MKSLSVIAGAFLSFLIASCASSPPVVEFGDDLGRWANDGECDDPRFSGEGVAVNPFDEDAYHDASDCRALYQSGRIQLAGDGASRAAAAPVYIEGMDFGSDYSEWANNGECDDPRFIGPGAARKRVQADRFKDATDCSNLFHDGAIQLAEGASAVDDRTIRIRFDDIDFGDDTGGYAYDDACDDPRFTRLPGADQRLRDRFRDATDCSILYQRGAIQIQPERPAIALSGGAPQAGRLSGDGRANRYSYQGRAGTLVVFDLRSPAFDTYLTVVTPGGTSLSNDDYGGDYQHSQLTLPLSETGEYLLEVTGYNASDSGAYTLTLSEVVLVADDTYEGSLDRGDAILNKGEYADTYTFEGKPGQSVTIELGSSDFDTFLVLRTPDGALQSNDDAACSSDTCANFSSTSLIERQLSAVGTYTVRVTSYATGETGAYQLRILRSEVIPARN